MVPSICISLPQFFISLVLPPLWPFKKQEEERKEEGEWTKDPLSTRRALKAVTEITRSLAENL